MAPYEPYYAVSFKLLGARAGSIDFFVKRFLCLYNLLPLIFRPNMLAPGGDMGAGESIACGPLVQSPC